VSDKAGPEVDPTDALVSPHPVADDREIDAWLERAFTHVRTMPPKK
jgi:hypothetical protein